MALNAPLRDLTGPRRRLGYFVAHAKDRVDAKIAAQALRTEEIMEMDQILSISTDLQPAIFGFQIVEANFQEIQSHAIGFSEFTISESVEPISLEDKFEDFLQISRKILNFLASTSSFLTLASRSVQNLNPTVAEKWNERRKNLHANELSYRLLYELRNYSQHYGLPISGLRVSKQLNSSNSNPVSSIYLSKSKLLACDFDWKKLRSDIEKLDENILIVPLIDRYRYIIGELCRDLISGFKDLLELSNLYLENLRSLVRVPVNGQLVVWVGESSDSSTPPSSFELLSTAQIEHILLIHRQLLSVDQRTAS